MKTTKQTLARMLLILAILLSLLSVPAIEGLKVEVRCPDVVLTWPSQENETYIVQHRSSLDTNASWVWLTNGLPADVGTNRTSFVHSNQVECPELPLAERGSEELAGKKEVQRTWPVVAPADGSRMPVPLGLYPEGIDLTGQVITWPDGTTDLWSRDLVAQWRASRQQEALLRGEGEGGGDSSEVAKGFYRVVRNGVHLIGLTNGMTLSGIVTFPVEVGHHEGQLNHLSVNEGGAPVSDMSIQSAPFTYPLSISIDTTSMSNGVHEMSAASSWYIPGVSNPNFAADSPPVTVNVYNEISFPNWMPLYGQLYDALYIPVQSGHAQAAWYVDVYGEDAGYIGTFGGTTQDGSIEVVWDLIGPYGEHYSDNYFDFVVETVYEQAPGVMASSAALAPRIYRNRDQWSARGDWVVANQLFWEYYTGSDQLNMMADGFAGMVEDGFGLTVRPTRPSGEAFRIHYNDGNEVSSWQAFRQALYHPNSRNLFYSGHGCPNGIGYNAADTNVFISRAEIAAVLRTVPTGQSNRHAFRFVFLDGCGTANGHLAEAFGITRRENLPYQHYYNAGERYSAFVGWNKSPEIGYAGSVVNVNHWKFIQNFQFLWLTENLGLRESLNQAKSRGPGGANNIDPTDLTVFGYRDLGVNQNNGL